jgi:DNA-binding response OmpR family regulator
MSARKVLLIEDNEELRRLYSEVFKRHDFTVYEAGDGQTGVDYALMYRPDAIILDLMLPRQGGLGALRVFRSHPESKHVPIFILTALPNPEYQQMAEGRVQGYFLKTQIKPKELVDAVSKALTA